MQGKPVAKETPTIVYPFWVYDVVLLINNMPMDQLEFLALALKESGISDLHPDTILGKLNALPAAIENVYDDVEED